ncbi:MAG TPA: hypothetical protein VMM93_11235 [Vicinamibacterales bacterium]|nr:hypothetical protein [Vicinamibacterales bacterium]
MRTLLLATMLVAALTTSGGAQAGQATGNPAPQPPAHNNIRVDLTITDTYTEAPSTKTVTMLVLNGQQGRVRTQNRLPEGHVVELNVDAQAVIVAAGQVRLRLTLEYTPAQQAPAGARVGPAQLHESLTVALRDGQQLVVSQSADPATDRKVTVEVTATILK